ncbi:hypothetical protein RRG08_026283 [Elysia crispata]|uniref:Uncharacterized protein n=1 Tax=Elysia crispata TaxID=231223 RepID=A0AAE0ZAM0_9GAST|nr:hypothetical protein RRG08_026283 [Elysia crispata]
MIRKSHRGQHCLTLCTGINVALSTFNGSQVAYVSKLSIEPLLLIAGEILPQPRYILTNKFALSLTHRNHFVLTTQELLLFIYFSLIMKRTGRAVGPTRLLTLHGKGASLFANVTSQMCLPNGGITAVSKGHITLPS